MFKLVQYKINRIPRQIYFRFVFASVWYLSVCLFVFFSCLFDCIFISYLFHQRRMATFDSNKTESFCSPRSWTNNLSRRHKRHRKYGKSCIYLFMVYLLFRGIKYSLENNMKDRQNFFSLSRRLSVSQQQLYCSIS